jgi:hypothetical protein
MKFLRASIHHALPIEKTAHEHIQVFLATTCPTMIHKISTQLETFNMNDPTKVQGVQEFCASILYLVVLCQFLISDARLDSFEKGRERSRAQRGRFLDKSQK